MSTEPTVFVVDDDEDIRKALKWLIESVGLPVELFVSAEDFLESHCSGRPGCLVLDVRMPGMGGLLLLEQMKRMEGPMLPTIVMTGHGEVSMAVQALKAGAVDFVEKPAINQLLLDLIHKALASDHVLRTRALELQNIRHSLHQLTHRERQVLDHIVAGELNKRIADQLDISERTVEKFRGIIMKKMKASSLAALVRMTVLEHLDAESTTLR